MKRFLAILLLVSMIPALCGCAKTNVSQSANVTLIYQFGGKNITVSLEPEEAEKVVGILDGNSYDPVWSGIPSCGFSSDIALNVNGRVYAVARDTCNKMQDMGNLRYFSVSEDEIDYIHDLFKKYGGKFPCI